MLEIKLSNLYQHADIFYDCLVGETRKTPGYRSGDDLAKDFLSVWERGNPKIIMTWLVKYFPDINQTTSFSYSDSEAQTIIGLLADPSNHKQVIDSALAHWGSDFKRHWSRTMEIITQNIDMLGDLDNEEFGYGIGNEEIFVSDETIGEYEQQSVNVVVPKTTRIKVESSSQLIGLENNKICISSYNGIINDAIGQQIEYLTDCGDIDEDTDYKFDFDLIGEIVVQNYNEWLSSLIATGKLPGVVSANAVSLFRQKDYNYSNDYVAINFVVESDIINSSNCDLYDAYTKGNYSGGDGYLNFMPESYDEYLEQIGGGNVERAYSSAISFLISENVSYDEFEEFVSEMCQTLDMQSIIEIY